MHCKMLICVECYVLDFECFFLIKIDTKQRKKNSKSIGNFIIFNHLFLKCVHKSHILFYESTNSNMIVN